MEKELFVDADAFVALRDKTDPNHQLAIAVSGMAASAGTALITSDPAFGEAITVISQNINHRASVDFANDVIGSQIEIVEVDTNIRNGAVEIFEDQTSKNSRFTDAVNMVIMKDRDLKEIFSFDIDYKKNGFMRLGIDKKLEGEVVDKDKK
jgi:predicted nucleic acid-binding protein